MVKTVLLGRGSYVPGGAQCLGFWRKNLAKTLTNILLFLPYSCHLWSLFLHCITRVKNITSYLYSALNILLEVDELYVVPQRHPTNHNIVDHTTLERTTWFLTNAVFCDQSISFSNRGLVYIVQVSFVRELLFSFRCLQPRSCIIRHTGPRMQTDDNQKGRKSTGPSFPYGTYFLEAFLNMAAFFKKCENLNYFYLYWANRDLYWTYFQLILN